MALRTARQWRSMLRTAAQNRAFASATAPRFATTVNHGGHDIPTKSKYLTGDAMPIMMLGGFIMLVLTIGAHSTWQQLAYSPSVQVKKKKRETVPEVYEPDAVLGSADKFVSKSFLRKVGNIQERKPVLADPIRPDPFTTSRDVETLKTVGVRP